MKKIVAYVLPLVILVPALALAQNFTYVNNWLNQGIYWLRLAITIFMFLMTFFFLFTGFQFISSKDANKQKDARSRMIQGMIGLFVAVAVWGIIRIAGNVLGINTADPNASRPVGITCPPGLVYSTLSGTCQRP